MTRMIRRGVAAGVLSGVALLATPGLASADTMIYQGTTASGGHQYYNVNTGATIVSSQYRGSSFDTCVQQVQ